ncbi:MAG: DUF4384 domain-containing protein [Pyrinomonadaceae bacterium]|nr:DUF4384 domain-containing protein [Pyrinomonadaceae bacterium]
MKTKNIFSLTIIAGLWLCSAAVQPSAAQEEGSKGIKAEEFIKDRPAKPVGGRRTVPTKKPTYKTSQVAAAAAVPPPGKVFAQVGVTLWRARPSTSGDKTKELVEEGASEPTQWSLERIEEGTLLAPGQKVRLSIESLSRDGYLYVINREEYADGSLGDARLIFPTKRTPEGADRVKAGKMVYIPGPRGYFRIKPSSSPKGHVAEVLTVLVSSKPLIKTSQLSDTAITLSREQVEAWEQQWATQATKFEMEGGAGRVMTEKEQSAASADAASLSQDDPVPQTIYRLAIKPDDALVIRLPLKFTPPKP